MEETKEDLDLDSLIDLLDDTEESKSANGEQTHNWDNSSHEEENGLDCVLGFICENDTTNEIAEASSVPRQKETLKPNDFNFFDVTEQSDTPSATQNDMSSSLVHTGDTSSDEEEKDELTETGEMIKREMKLRSNYSDRTQNRESKTWKSRPVAGSPSTSKEEPSSLDKLTGMRIVKPLVAFDVMQTRLQGRKLIKMSFIKGHLRKGNDIEGDWVTIGALVKKVPPKTSRTGKVFSIWKLTDLHNTEHIVSLFLFGKIHTEHWKTPVGTVVGLLNPEIMDPNEKSDYLSVKVDHPGKIMMIGTSKDFGHCKSKRKDGTQCTMVVNLSQCQYCLYHIKSEYNKFGKRSDIQSSWSGNGLTVRDKVLKGQNFFYGGQTFSPLGKQPKKSKFLEIPSKDKLTLSNLVLKGKAATVYNEEKSKSVEKIAEVYGEAVSKTAERNSEFINNQLLIPSAGSRNFLQHMIKNKTPAGKNVSVVHPKELLMQHALQLKSRMNKKDDFTLLKRLGPELGRGLKPGQDVTFNIQSPKLCNLGQHAKMKAIRKIKENGPIKRKNPNSVKSNPEPKKIKAAVERSFEENAVDVKPKGNEMLRTSLGCIDLNSERVQKILNRKSKHEYEVEMAEMEKEAAYFDRLEKKEMMEEKMSTTKEIVCSVVSCKQCRYTAHCASDRCKNENHPLKCHKAIKRFYACKDCKHRVECFTRFPLISCSQCGSSRYERTGMIRVRSGPKLDSEILNIRFDDAYFLNSL